MREASIHMYMHVLFVCIYIYMYVGMSSRMYMHGPAGVYTFLYMCIIQKVRGE